MRELPVAQSLATLKAALLQSPAVVLTADTGSGKTTWLPLQLLHEPWLNGKRIVMLEPRRVAARAAAARLSHHLNEPVGKSVGYAVRFDRVGDSSARIEVVTEGILARRLIQDPELAGTGLLIFDEFHERHIETDMALALAIECQRVFRPDLKLLIMSATIDTAAVSIYLATALGSAEIPLEIPVITSKGTSFPVEVHYYRDQLPLGNRAIAELCARKALTAHADHQGDILIFLPGVGEIRTACELIEARNLANTEVLTLYGEMSNEEQARVLAPSQPGQRRIIVATPIAESSLTLEGLHIVIDSGLVRQPAFRPGIGLSYLETVAITQDSAVQRAGRAGRLGPGICYRMYAEADLKRRPKTRTPEILRSDLAQAMLTSLAFGSNLKDLALPDPPSDAAFAQASALLFDLGCTDGMGKLTAIGKAAARLPLAPRLAVMLVKNPDIPTAVIAALLTDRTAVQAGPTATDLGVRIEEAAAYLLGGQSTHLHSRGQFAAVKATFDQIVRIMRIVNNVEQVDVDTENTKIAISLLSAYPDRIALRRQTGTFLLRTGRSVDTEKTDWLADAEFIVVADAEGTAQKGKLRLGFAVTRSVVLDFFKEQIVIENAILLVQGKPSAFRQERLGAIVLSEREIPLPVGYKRELLFQTIRDRGLATVIGDVAQNLCVRVQLIESWGLLAVQFSYAELEQSLEAWLGGFISDSDTIDSVDFSIYTQSLHAKLGFDSLKLVNELLPEKLSVPSGGAHPIQYTHSKAVVSVRIQEVFGLNQHPVLANGRLPISFELLSPRRQPIATTTNLPEFWKSTYAEVRKEMRGKYPKHFWPEDPLSMQGTTGTKKAFDRKR